MMKNFLCALGLTLALGCATAIVRPYVGEQQSWPTANGAICSVEYDLPVFTSLPPSPYEVVAELRISSPLYAQPVEGHLATLVKESVRLGADALVFVDGQKFFGTQYGVSSGSTGAAPKKASVTEVNRFNPEVFRPGVTIIAIRWITEPPQGLPPRYAKYSDKLLTNQPPPATEAPVVLPPPTLVPAKVKAVPVTPSPSHTNIQGSKPPVPEPPAAPATPEPPKPETPPVAATPSTPETPKTAVPPTPVTPEPPKAEVTPPAVTAPNWYVPSTPATPKQPE